ncbi:MAG: hypothetical protein AMJ78_01880 [Omnitrophica WOR_2 bacterium SM23_29]|nr:MAG: hypothetical protein AMJ78_01880 [Omnitrophica WOR_2 bacterium SM23_29]
MYESIILDNKTRCVGLNIPDRDSLSIGIWIKVGGRYEPQAKCGVSHFLEHLLFKGTTRRSGEEIKRAIEGRGGSINGFTTEEFTCYLVKVLSRDMDIALDILSDMILNSRLTLNDIEKERTVIIEEIKMYKDLPMHYVHELLAGLLWPNQPLGRFLAGTVESVSKIKRRDIRSFKNRFYNPRNIVVAACGKMQYRNFFTCCEKHFKKIPRSLKSTFRRAEVKQRKPQYKVLFRDTEQAHLSMGLHTFGRNDPDKHALNFLHIILGGNMSSRLFRELREKRGLVYEIGTHVKKFQDTGAFVISVGLDDKKIPKTIELILRELRKIKTKSVGAEEFNRAKEFYRGQLLLALEDTSDHMLWMGEHMVGEDKIPTPQEILDEIEKVTADDLMRVANRVFKNSRLNLALIGPTKKTDEKKIEEVLTIR